ncbi:hydroxysqualene dehydroxylase HpnE [Sphingomonas sp. NFR15]|uniref:hydroxysqualene dehydroxylase HpnE n=1 Tax=Sphingomonas sp. NFR15 TaxID=1566282 RepID=UPI00088DD1FB|nr:hydroxysqualene dehydroxylase HpnE [Sphingomonas sp. NFR15]SDA15251.1 squalene-associated FAD-dependent desaturase [Sphingomonas sp. NFR15]
MSRRARVIGAGMAGLSAAVELARGGFAVSISEGAAQAGGRCRSYHDPQLGRVIDNGNHLVLSGNDGVAQFLATIGASDRLAGPDSAEFDFADRRTGERWSFRPNDGRLPWWIFSKTRRVPGTTARDYLRLAALTSGKRGQTVADRIETRGVLWERLLEPVLLAALNTAPADGDVTLTAAIVNQTLGRGGKAMKPRIAEPTLAAAFVDPATEWLAARGASLALGERLRAIGFDGDRVITLDFGNGAEPVAPDEAIILAVPAWIAESLVPDLTVPDDHRAIINAHFAFTPPPGTPPMVGVIGGTAEWIFAFPDRLSVTVSGADRLIDTDRSELAAAFWADIAAIHQLPPELPRWQIVKEKRATFAATPAQERRRPPAATRWRNLFLAGDWTQTGLPATIEGALRSGATAARLARDARLL